MKIITMATDSVDYTLLKTNRESEVFLTSTTGTQLLTEYVTNCRTVDAEENFLFLCNDTATVTALKRILAALGLTNHALILFGVDHFDAVIICRLQKIHRLQNTDALKFFRAAYGKFQR